MANSDLREWAVKGAEQRLVELAEEARAIFAAFPELRGQGRGFEVSRGRKVEPPALRPQAPSQEDVSRRSTEDCSRSEEAVGGMEEEKGRKCRRLTGHARQKESNLFIGVPIQLEPGVAKRCRRHTNVSRSPRT